MTKGILHDLHGRHVRRAQHLEWGANSGRWGGVANSATGQCLALVAGSPDAGVYALDYGVDGAHLFGVARVVLAPHATFTGVNYLVLAPDVTQARLYRCLESIAW